MSRWLKDQMNRVTLTTAADTDITRYAYDNNGDLLTLTDPNSHVRSWTYDSRRRVKTTTDALGLSITLNYDGQGNLISRRYGTTITYSYDALNRVKQTNLPALSNGIVAFVTALILALPLLFEETGQRAIATLMCVIVAMILPWRADPIAENGGI
jgi:YD repeat-containing protein